MRFNRFEIPKDLLISADVLNTLQGGMSQPSIKLKREEEGYILNVRVPGVEPEKMQIELKNNQLFIFHHITLNIENPELEGRTIPFNVGYVNIPFDADIRNINAIYEDKLLKVIMPFNEFAGGYHRRIHIDTR